MDESIVTKQETEILRTLKVHVKAKESCSVLSMPGMGKNYIFNLFVNDLNNSDLEKDIVFLYANPLTKKDLIDFIDKIEETRIEKEVLVVVTIFLGEDCSDEIIRLNKIKIKRGIKFTSILFLTISSCINLLAEKTVEILSQSILILKPLNADDTLKLINKLENSFNLQINTENKNKIIKLSGGNIGIIRSIFMHLVNNSDFEINSETIFKIYGVVGWIQEIFKDLPENLSESLVSTIRNFQDAIFLERFGYIDEIGNLFSPLIQEYAAKFLKTKLLISTKELEKGLSEQELLIFNLLSGKKNIVVSRNEIADTLWEEESSEKYSDWAIDQIIFRLRKKIEKSGIDSIKIKTRKGNGFILSDI